MWVILKADGAREIAIQARINEFGLSLRFIGFF
jgi:hypothetical protein